MTDDFLRPGIIFRNYELNLNTGLRAVGNQKFGHINQLAFKAVDGQATDVETICVCLITGIFQDLSGAFNIYVRIGVVGIGGPFNDGRVGTPFGRHNPRGDFFGEFVSVYAAGNSLAHGYVSNLFIFQVEDVTPR